MIKLLWFWVGEMKLAECLEHIHQGGSLTTWNLQLFHWTVLNCRCNIFFRNRNDGACFSLNVSVRTEVMQNATDSQAMFLNRRSFLILSYLTHCIKFCNCKGICDDFCLFFFASVSWFSCTWYNFSQDFNSFFANCLYQMLLVISFILIWTCKIQILLKLLSF